MDGTDDDPEFKTLDDIRVALGFTTEQYKALAPLVGRTRSCALSASASQAT